MLLGWAKPCAVHYHIEGANRIIVFNQLAVIKGLLGMYIKVYLSQICNPYTVIIRATVTDHILS